MARCERAELIGLLLDSGDDARVLVAEVGEDQLRAEIQVAATIGIDDVATGATNEGQNVARPLHTAQLRELVTLSADAVAD